MEPVIPWIGVDLDGTLAHQQDPHDHSTIGIPIAPMVERVKGWIAEGRNVWIFTARLSGSPEYWVKPMIEGWCLEHLGKVLPITNVKEHGLIEFWDDRAVGVLRNTGQRQPTLSDEAVLDGLRKGSLGLKLKKLQALGFIEGSVSLPSLTPDGEQELERLAR